MEPDRLGRLVALGGWEHEHSIEIAGSDPVLPTPWPVGEVAATALGLAGDAAARLARRAGANPGPTRVTVADAAAATIGFALVRVDGAPMTRTNTDNPWVGRYRCADDRWVHLHGGFASLADRLADVLDLPSSANGSAIAEATFSWRSEELEDAVADARGCAVLIRSESEWRRHPQGENSSTHGRRS